MSRDLLPIDKYKSPFTDTLSSEKKYFCYQHAIDLSPQQSAERCGITPAKARKFLRDPQVKKAIQDIRSRVASMCEITLADLYNEAKRVALFDMKSVIKDIDFKTGEIKFIPFKEMDGRAIAEVKVTETKTGKRIISIKPYGKMAATKLLVDALAQKDGPTTNVQVNINNISGKDAEAAMDMYSMIMSGKATISAPDNVEEAEEVDDGEA